MRIYSEGFTTESGSDQVSFGNVVRSVRAPLWLVNTMKELAKKLTVLNLVVKVVIRCNQ